jgi:hypothetical protein
MVSLFKNISYPLFWADESMAVMGGVRVLEYGYPKVHDGKNVFDSPLLDWPAWRSWRFWAVNFFIRLCLK